eukprot:CAMPEP_0118636804 /NCGR_PEP_ID=MMETSP0785-20121206/2822_1 /TAXON_ID=91992 /ORGANISM="Bolidomonas pacifica, Strain CCMP 1866" /LENGTH=140 /DNA_ID=CAMNT_0006527963 /DNA_START=431 /DNA_END=850 /DNA_ORIENTATION=-
MSTPPSKRSLPLELISKNVIESILTTTIQQVGRKSQRLNKVDEDEMDKECLSSKLPTPTDLLTLGLEDRVSSVIKDLSTTRISPPSSSPQKGVKDGWSLTELKKWREDAFGCKQEAEEVGRKGKVIINADEKSYIRKKQR